MDNLGLVKFVESKIGTPYVYGMKGGVLTETKYEQLKAMYVTWFGKVTKRKSEKYVLTVRA